MLTISFELNGQPKTVEVPPSSMLADVVRELGLTGTKIGCREGHCGACMVLVDGRAINSCLMLAARAHGKKVTTIEGLGTVFAPHPIQEAFVAAGIVQCGYCTPGMVLSTKALLDRDPNPSREDTMEALAGNLCRCTGYAKVHEAVQSAAALLAGKAGSK